MSRFPKDFPFPSDLEIASHELGLRMARRQRKERGPRGEQAWGTITIRKGANLHDPARRQQIIDWLKRTIETLENEHEQIGPTYRARLLP